MADSILCPQVGQDLTEAKVVALHVKLGDKVKKGDIVADLAIDRQDFAKNTDVVPVSDPHIFSETQRMAQRDRKSVV